MIIIMGDGRKFSHIACRWIGYYGVSATACFQRGKLRLFPFLHLSPFTTASHINSVNFHLFRSQQLPNGTNPLYRSTSHRCYTRPRNSDAGSYSCLHINKNVGHHYMYFHDSRGRRKYFVQNYTYGCNLGAHQKCGARRWYFVRVPQLTVGTVMER